VAHLFDVAHKRLHGREEEPKLDASFYHQGTPATTYVRCQLPARYLPGQSTPLAGGGSNVNPLTSYGYRTIGIIVEMTPRVTYDGDIILDVSLDPELHRDYGERIPVLELDGEELFEFHVEEADLAAKQANINLFQRFALMRTWRVTEGQQVVERPQLLQFLSQSLTRFLSQFIVRLYPVFDPLDRLRNLEIPDPQRDTIFCVNFLVNR